MYVLCIRFSLKGRCPPTTDSPSPIIPVASFQNRFPILSDPAADVPTASANSGNNAGPQLTHDIPPPRSPRSRDSRKTANKRHQGSTDSIESSSVPPSKVSVCSPRLRSADRVSSPAAVDSVRPLERFSSQGNVVPATPAATVISTLDKMLLDVEIHNSKSSASMTSVARSNTRAFSDSREPSESGEVACMDCSNTNTMVTPRSDSVPSRSGTFSRIPVLPRAGPSGLQDSQLLSLPGMVKGNPFQRLTRSVLPSNSIHYHTMELYSELRVLLSRFSPACVCLQEIFLRDQSHSRPPGYRVFFQYLSVCLSV